ncbi:MAG TPA: helix-turn-helix domain-containing protein [Candidatus Ligilactobacillus faecavium]|nr:helix-turn-helix domain-containing protein [Candidatus Ligilactobacillus faecavium]
MADLLGVSLPTYANYENGKTLMRVDTADKFSKIVKIPKQQLIFF